MSCTKGVDLSRLDHDYLVASQVETEFKQKKMKTYFIENRVFLYDDTENNKKEKEWIYGENENAIIILDALNNKLVEHGFKRVYNQDEADLSIAIAYFYKAIHIVKDDWWIDWDKWHSDWKWPFKPYSATHFYTYDVGNFEIILVDNESYINKNPLLRPVIWKASAVGLAYGDNLFKEERVVRAINIAFDQCSYMNALKNQNNAK